MESWLLKCFHDDHLVKGSTHPFREMIVPRVFVLFARRNFVPWNPECTCLMAVASLVFRAANGHAAHSETELRL